MKGHTQQLRVSKSGPDGPDCYPNRSPFLRGMRFVAGRGAVAKLLVRGAAVAERHREEAGRGAVADSHWEDAAGKGAHKKHNREKLTGKNAQKPRFCARTA